MAQPWKGCGLARVPRVQRFESFIFRHLRKENPMAWLIVIYLLCGLTTLFYICKKEKGLSYESVFPIALGWPIALVVLLIEKYSE